jgi:hypothetical protein
MLLGMPCRIFSRFPDVFLMAFFLYRWIFIQKSGFYFNRRLVRYREFITECQDKQKDRLSKVIEECIKMVGRKVGEGGPQGQWEVTTDQWQTKQQNKNYFVLNLYIFFWRSNPL